MSFQVDEQALRSGVLLRQGGKIRSGAWVKRFVALTASSLTFFNVQKKDQKGSLLHVLQVETINGVEFELNKNKKKFIFAIKTHGEDVKLCAATDEERKA